MKEFFKLIVREYFTLEWLYAFLSLMSANIAGASAVNEFYFSAFMWLLTSFLWLRMSKTEGRLNVADAE